MASAERRAVSVDMPLALSTPRHLQVASDRLSLSSVGSRLTR